MCLKDLESRHDLRKGYAAIFLPVPDDFWAVDEDDEAVRRAVEDHLALRSVSARHVGGECSGLEMDGLGFGSVVWVWLQGRLELGVEYCIVDTDGSWRSGIVLRFVYFSKPLEYALY